MALVAMLAMVSASSGCSDDGVDYSVTIVAKTTLSLSKNAGTGRLAYEIQGADKSSIVEATTNVDWIKNFNYAEPGYVQFDYTALDEGVESRSGQITLSYTGAADVVVTVNQGGTMTFELTIDPKSITANGCAMQIVPSNESETYLCAFMTKEYVDSFESDEAFIQADLEAVKEQAESRGMKLSEWLNILLMKGSKTNTVDDLSLANTAYYGYVYGCTSEGVPTTDLFKAEFTTQNVAYGFAYASGTYQSDLSTGRVESKPLPRNDNATVSGTWQVYNGDELAARYPSAWKDYKGVQYVCVYQAEPTSEETAHTWVFVHAPRGGDLPLPDMLIFDYFENYPFVAIYKDAKHGRCSPPGVGPWGFYYAGQDETGAWGPLGYETIMMNDPDHQGDIDTAPTDGFDDKREDKSSVSTVSKVSLSAPIRFSQASFIQIERERMDHGKATIFNTPKKEATVNVDFDVDAQLKNITDNIR